jgi:N-acylneuraminate cytidylyltransferase
MTEYYTALITARGGFKGILGKNIRLIQGRPLLSWSIAQALACRQSSRVLVSTDHSEIAAIAKDTGEEIPSLRPACLAEDTTSTEAVMLQVAADWLNWRKQTIMVLPQPTSPLRRQKSCSKEMNSLEGQTMARGFGIE